MASSLYRCQAKVWLKVQGWEYAIAYSEKEILSISTEISVPKPGQVLNYRSGFPLYENSANCTVKIVDKYLLKAGYIGLEASQRLKSVPVVDVPEEYRISVEELTSEFDDSQASKDLREHLTNAEYATVVIEFSYAFGLNQRFLAQKYFFRLKSSTSNFANNNSSFVTLQGEGLYRSVLSQTRENYAIKQGTPIKEFLRETHNFANIQSTGKAIEGEPEITTDVTVQNKVLTFDVRTNGGSTAALVAKVEASHGITIVENPSQPFKYNVISDTPSTRSAFYLGIGLFEGFEFSGEALTGGANTIRNISEVYKNNGESTGKNKDNYNPETQTPGTFTLPDKIKAYITSVSNSKKSVSYIHPVLGKQTIDLTAWMQSRAGNPNIKELIKGGTIVTQKTAHAAYDNPSEKDSKVYTLFGGEIVAREPNETRGNGVIKIKTNAWLKYREKEYRITEYYAHCIDHVDLGDNVKPGDAIATVSNKSESQTTNEKHLHGSFWIEYQSGRVYVNPEVVLKYAYIRTDVTTPEEKPSTVTKGLYPESEALLRLVLAEGRLTGVLGMALVARCVFNRSCAIKNKWQTFNTAGNKSDIYSVITASGQFQPVSYPTKDNDWKNVFNLSTKEQIAQGKEAIALAQKPDELKRRLMADGVSGSEAEELVLNTFFAAVGSASYIDPYIRRRIQYKQKNAQLPHIYGVNKSTPSDRTKTLCTLDSVNANGVSATGGAASSTSNGTATEGASGSSNTMAGAVGGQGLVGIPKISTSFIGVPRSLFIQPGFTYLIFDTRNFIEWAKANGRGEDFKVPIPLEYKDWSITGINYEWEGDLRVTLNAIRPLTGLDEGFKYTGDEFKDIPQWQGNYKKYIRSFTDLCYEVKSGSYAGKNSCEVKIDINTAFVPQPSSENPSVVTGNNSTTGGTNEWQIPASGLVTSVFGRRRSGIHKGVDIAANGSIPIYAASNGTVTVPPFDFTPSTGRGYGNWIIIDHGNGYTSRYGHLRSISVKTGDRVNLGTQIGLMGNTGGSTGQHLHWEVRKNNTAINPKEVFSKLGVIGTIIKDRDRTFYPRSGNSSSVPQSSNNYHTCLRLVNDPSGLKNSLGNPIRNLLLYKEGVKVNSFNCVTGRADTQNRDRNRSGTEAPLPKGTYTVSGNTTSGLVPEVGATFLPITPDFSTGRSALGIHLDPSFNKNNGEDGSSGCIGLTNTADVKAVNSFAQANQPLKLFVEF